MNGVHRQTSRRRRLLNCLAVILGLAASDAACRQPSDRFVREISWQGHGVWVKADTHMHTRFSDGSHTVEELVTKAEEFGCEVVAITDHTDRNLTAATQEYFAAIDAARRAHPKLIILAGVEWNIPPWNGEEHATVLVAPAAEPTLTEFKAQFDDLGRPSHDATLAADGLRWLAAHSTANGVSPVVIYQHPSRADAHSMENVADILAWRRVNDLAIGFAGAPGHQRPSGVGAYNYKEKPIDRWDPVAARIGDAWDTLLGQGLDVWAADAPSDFHSEGDTNDFWPGQFSETWLNVPTRDAVGVLQAYRAGAYFADHGRIVRDVALEVSAPGLARAAGPGETIAVVRGSTVTVALRFEVPPTAWPEGPNHIDQIEIIGVDTAGARVVASGSPQAGAVAFSSPLTVPEGGIVLRARGYRNLPDGTRLAFYTNPVRVQVLK